MSKKTFYQFEIEANEKPLYEVGEWESLNELTKAREEAAGQDVVAYGEVEAGKYIELYSK